MGNGYNKVQLRGVVTDVFDIANGKGTRYTLEIHAPIGDKDDATTWQRVVAWGKHEQATNGATVAVEGALVTRTYDSRGEKKYDTHVVASKFVVEQKGAPRAQRPGTSKPDEQDIPF